MISRDWHHGPTVSLAKLSFQEHANLAAQHSGKDHWEYRRLDVYAVEALRSSKTAERGKNVPSELSWLDQQGLNVKDVSKDGTVDDVTTSRPLRAVQVLSFVHYTLYFLLEINNRWPRFTPTNSQIKSSP